MVVALRVSIVWVGLVALAEVEVLRRRMALQALVASLAVAPVALLPALVALVVKDASSFIGPKATSDGRVKAACEALVAVQASWELRSNASRNPSLR